MILPDFVLTSRVNQHWQYSGIDSLNYCNDKKHFKQYPYNISYHYNSRGYRDQEWPATVEELKKCIWCFGDSFTVGIGSPLEHTWPYLLEKKLGTRVINISLDGASNNWIACQVKMVQNEIRPKNIVIMWSYLHRRESADCTKTDEARRIQNDRDLDNHGDLLNFQHCKDLVKNHSSNPVQLSIPDYTGINPTRELDSIDQSWQNIRGKDWPYNVPRSIQELLSLSENIQFELKEQFKTWNKIETSLRLQSFLSLLESNIIKVDRIDLARDGHHFDLLTAQWVVDQITTHLMLPCRL